MPSPSDLPAGLILPFNLTSPAEGQPTSVSDAPASGARATPVSVPSDAQPLPLSLAAAYGVYTLLNLIESITPPSIETFLADPREVTACNALAAVVLQTTCDTSPHLAKLRTIAGKTLQTHPAIGQELVEALAGLDAELQGKA